MIALSDLMRATSAQVLQPAGNPAGLELTCADLAFDSRLVEPGQLFVAVVTETGDGHDYILEACHAGATGVLCQRAPLGLPAGVTCLLVEDTQQALQDYARYILAARQIEVIGVTGSVGKTTTKEAIAAVLGTRLAVFKSPGSYNGRFGLPIGLGRLQPEQHLAVLELACDSLDEIRVLADMTRPRVGVVTTVGHSHAEFLGTLEDIAREKGRLVEALPADGLAILNADDPRVLALRNRARARVVTYGLSPSADVRGDQLSSSIDGTRLIAHSGTARVPLELQLVGAHSAYSALAATAVGLAYGLTAEQISQGLAQLQPLPGRMRVLDGANGSRLIDDSYNASPLSAKAAMNALALLATRCRIVVLGDMAQLGPYAEQAHRELGRRCAQIADLLVTKGELARLAAKEAARAGMASDRIRVTYSAADTVRAVRPALQPGALVLIAGSAESRLEFVTRDLLADPEGAPRLLPRQSRGWGQVRLARPGRPTWVEVDLDAIAHNTRLIAAHVGERVMVLAVVKGDGYGHGAVKVARTALNNGASWLGVACVAEAVALRSAGISAPILSLGYTPPWQARAAVLHNVTCTLFSPDVAKALSRAAADLGSAAKAHVKVDTGMGRLGLLPDEVPGFVHEVSALPGLDVEGIYTHMADADGADLGYTRQQLECFEVVLARLRADGLLPRLVHAANSAAALRLPSSHYSMVRVGIALYGLNPSSDSPLPTGFRPALSFKCQVAQVKALPAGASISYGRTFVTQRPSRIAVIPVGYADGFRRGPANWDSVLVRGRPAPIVGRVCMDQTMLDVTDIDGVRAGDEVVLIGSQGDLTITVDEVARRLGTSNYEVVSEILARVPRVV